MATLKDLIKTETLKVGSHGAMPSERGVIVLSDGTSIGNWGSIYSGVAPTDGFIAVNAKSANTAAACVIDNANGYSVGKLWGKAGAKIGLTLPFARGTKISVNGNDLSEITVRFIKSIGGGYKRYLKALSCNRFGGLLWLRLKTTSEWNRVLSCLQTRSGLRLSLHHRLSVASTSNLQRLVEKTLMWLLKLGGCISKLLQASQRICLTLFPSQAAERGCRVATQQLSPSKFSLLKSLYKKDEYAIYGFIANPSMLHTLSHQLVASNNARMEVAA